MSLTVKRHLYTVLTILGAAAAISVFVFVPYSFAVFGVAVGCALIYGIIYGAWVDLTEAWSDDDDTYDHGW